MAADPEAPPAAAADANVAQWRTATTQVRDTIKYIVAGFAAVGAILVGTAPLAGLGKVQGLGWWIAAGLGAAAAVGGVVFAVWQASDVLLPEVVTLDQVVDAKADSELGRLRANVLGGTEGLFRLWGGTIASFRNKRDLEYIILRNLYKFDSSPAREETVKYVVDTIGKLNRAAEVALAGAQYAWTRDLALDRRKGIAWAAVAVTLGVGVFTIAVTRPAADSTTVKPKQAQRAALTLTAAGRKDLDDLLGDGCAEPIPALVLSGGTAGPWDVATTGEGGCRPAHFTLAADEGVPVYVEARTVVVTLSDKGKARLGPVLGADCVAEPIEAIELGDDRKADLVSLATPMCRAARFSLAADEGAVRR